MTGISTMRWGGTLSGIILWVMVCGAPLSARAQFLRVVNYNVEADVNGNTAPNNGLSTVLEAIGEQSSKGVAQPIDILALEETTSEPLTVQPIVTALNAYYGAGTYALCGFQATESGNNPSTGNGPNSLVYNTNTVTLLQAIGATGTPNQALGVNRQVARYKFQAKGAAATSVFYVYVSHMKSSYSGVESVDETDRNAEAKLIRADLNGLAAGASAFFVGDFNLNGSAEAAYQTLTAAGNGQGIDPLNFPQNNAESWDSATYQILLTETSTGLHYRDDIQFITQDIYNGTAAAALRYVPGSLRGFGNNGTTAVGKSVNLASNTALKTLAGPVTGSAALAALVTASDHLPVVADYQVSTPYNTWQLQNFSTADLANPAVSGDSADPDGDGIVNLLEYALNLNPKQAGAAGVPTVGQTTVNGSRYLTLTYTRVVAATGITYLPQVSGDLVTWNGGAGYTVAVSSTPSADGTTQTVVVRDAVAETGANSRFLRLSVSRP